MIGEWRRSYVWSHDMTSEMQLFAREYWILARRKRDKELYHVNPSSAEKMFVVWNVMEKFGDASVTAVIFVEFVGDGPLPSQMEVLFTWIFA